MACNHSRHRTTTLYPRPPARSCRGPTGTRSSTPGSNDKHNQSNARNATSTTWPCTQNKASILGPISNGQCEAVGDSRDSSDSRDNRHSRQIHITVVRPAHRIAIRALGCGRHKLTPLAEVRTNSLAGCATVRHNGAERRGVQRPTSNVQRSTVKPVFRPKRAPKEPGQARSSFHVSCGSTRRLTTAWITNGEQLRECYRRGVGMSP